MYSMPELNNGRCSYDRAVSEEKVTATMLEAQVLKRRMTTVVIFHLYFNK